MAGENPTEGGTLSLDTVLETLSNRRRRFALYVLAEAPDGVSTFDAVVDALVDLETSAGEVRREDLRKHIVSDLHHWHLPVLADVGAIECDERSGTIRYQPSPILEEWMEYIRRKELDDPEASTLCL